MVPLKRIRFHANLGLVLTRGIFIQDGDTSSFNLIYGLVHTIAQWLKEGQYLWQKFLEFFVQKSTMYFIAKNIDKMVLWGSVLFSTIIMMKR